MSIIDTWIEMFSPEAVDDLKQGGTNLKRDAKAVTRGLMSNAADFADFADLITNSKIGQFMERNMTPQWLYAKVTWKPQARDERFRKISDYLRNKYEGLLEKNLSPEEAQNVMEDFLEQGANHFDDLVTPWFWWRALPAIISWHVDWLDTSVADIQEKRATPSYRNGTWVEKAPWVRTFEWVNRKNLPVKNSKRKIQPSAQNQDPITL